MAKLIAFYSRADENYFGGAYRNIPVGNTEKAAKMLAELTCSRSSRKFRIRPIIRPVLPRPSATYRPRPARSW